MTVSKEKLIEEAQKLMMRGQLDKAVKLYQQLVTLDPATISHRQRLAEAMVKAGRLEDARKEFEKIGRGYADKGFYLKAIAVYKQIQKLFSADISITLMLAELNEKHGLTANAIAEYKLVYEHFLKSSNIEESLKILDRMQHADSQNLGIKFRLAEEYLKAGKRDDSYALFNRLASILQERGDTAGLVKLNSRIKQAFPEKTEFMLDVLAEQVRGPKPANAIPGLQAMLRADHSESRVWDLVVEAYQRLNQPHKVKAACQQYLRFFPGQLSPRIVLLECLVGERNLAGALELLDHHEHELIGAGRANELARIYTQLVELDPINLKVLAGMKQALEAAGRGSDAVAVAVASQIESLQRVAGSETKEQSSGAESDNPFGGGILPEVENFDAPSGESADGAYMADPGVGVPLAEDDLEIEIEIDGIDFDSSLQDDEAAPEGEGDVGLSDGIDELFAEFSSKPRGVKFASEVDSADARSHYDLGVAFKAMGLYDEALNEFQQAAVDPERKVECLVMQGACLRSRGDFGKSESLLLKLLTPGLSVEDACAVKYELALTCEASGRAGRAVELLGEIRAALPGFRDVNSLIETVSSETSLDFSEEDLQGFDLK